MAFLSRLFNKNEDKIPKGFHRIQIAEIVKLNPETVKVILAVPDALKSAFGYIPGQYLNFSISLNNKEFRRSYSICSGQDEDLAVAVKKVDKGIVSAWFNEKAGAGTELLVSPPEGKFILGENENNIVAFAAGSGITPILSIAKSISASEGKMRLFYGNKTKESILFKNEIDALDNISCKYFLSREKLDDLAEGRLDKEQITNVIKADLTILQADAFFLCGPEEMIMSAQEVLKMFGVSEKKIRFELFTTPVAMESLETEAHGDFSGLSNVTVFLDDEKIDFKLDSKGKTILETLDKEGYDAPYSCRGGVCCTCKAKVLEGSVKMDLNYTLTDEEVAEGYILTCQSHPASEKVSITYDV